MLLHALEAAGVHAEKHDLAVALGREKEVLAVTGAVAVVDQGWYGLDDFDHFSERGRRRDLVQLALPPNLVAGLEIGNRIESARVLELLPRESLARVVIVPAAHPA